ncbi:MAG: zinc-dependent metalloprotease [Aureispira sp.]
MNNIFIVAIALLCLYANLASAQHTSHTNHQECGTKILPRHKDRLQRAALARQHFQDNARAGTIYIPVRHIIVRRSNSTGGINTVDLQQAMDHLNAEFAPANIQFYECSRVYANHDTYYDFHQSQEAALASLYEVSNVVNIFYCNTVTTLDSLERCGYAKFPGGEDRIFIHNYCINNRSTLVHEFGHYLSLYHTHETTFGNELVNGSNCTTAGDFICDTEADPNISTGLNKSCVYIAGDTDANGDTYTPPTTNYMSYARTYCRTEFTPGQIAHLRYTAINDRAYLTCSCFSYDFVGFFNFGTTTSSHNYTTSANVYTTTAYSCDSDPNQLRVGSCSSAPNTGGDFVSVEFDVPAGTDKLRLLLRGGWQNGSSEVYIDGVYQRDFNLSTTNCSSNITYVYIYNISNLTQDGKVVIKLVDPDPGCSGDFNLDHMLVYAATCNQSSYAKLPYFTDFRTGVLDDYWLTQSSNEFGQAHLTSLYGPYSGGYHLIMNSNIGGQYANNQADLRVDLSTCSNVSLYFRWKEFNDESHPNDAVLLSDDGGENFVKVYSLTGGTYNTWNSATVDIDNLARLYGLSLSEEFIIRFQQFDNYPASTDGIAIDYVYLLGCSNTPAPMLAMVDEDRVKGHVQSVYKDSENNQDDPVLNTFNSIDNGVEINIFPNPAKDVLNLQLNAFETNEEVKIKVINMLGQVQYASNHTITNNTQERIQLQVQQLPAGIYTVVIENQQRIIAHQKVTLQ